MDIDFLGKKKKTKTFVPDTLVCGRIKYLILIGL